VEGSRKRARQEEQQALALSPHAQDMLAEAEDADEDEVARFHMGILDDCDDMDMDMDKEQEDELDEDEQQSDGNNFDDQNDEPIAAAELEERSASLNFSDD
jgi:hypothetical protein